MLKLCATHFKNLSKEEKLLNGTVKQLLMQLQPGHKQVLLLSKVCIMDSLLTLENSRNTILDLILETNQIMVQQFHHQSILLKLLTQRLLILLVDTILLVIQLILIASTANLAQELEFSRKSMKTAITLVSWLVKILPLMLIF